MECRSRLEATRAISTMTLLFIHSISPNQTLAYPYTYSISLHLCLTVFLSHPLILSFSCSLTLSPLLRIPQGKVDLGGRHLPVVMQRIENHTFSILFVASLLTSYSLARVK